MVVPLTAMGSRASAAHWATPTPVGAATPTVAIVHDYLTQQGRAELVVLAIVRAFPGASMYTPLYEEGAT